MKSLLAPILVTWVVLSAQPLCAQTEYTADGSHSALEEEIRWLANRGRFDTASENAARGTAYLGWWNSTGHRRNLCHADPA